MKKHSRSLRSFIALGFILVISPFSIRAQLNFPHDTSYYESYPDKLNTRVYLSRKYVRFTLPSSGDAKDIEYNINSKTNLGIGVTWHNYSLNIFYGFSFLNPDNGKGKTKGLDLQLHLYPRKWAIDLLAIFPKGLYLIPQGYAAAKSDGYYYREDIKFSMVGISAYRVPNKEKFSYRAAIIQNEWQKKSAGSPLFGGEAYIGTIKGDSALVPSQLQNAFQQSGVDNIHFLNIGPGIGYAYTFVIAKHLFITGSLVGNLDLSFSTEERMNDKDKKVGVSPSAVYKGAVGYNSGTWDISANVTGGALWMKSASSNKEYFLPTGNYRLVLARKITLKHHHHTS